MTGTSGALKYDVSIDPEAETSHGKLIRLVGRGQRVLDLGCASGGVAAVLIDRGCTVTGVEIDKQAAKLAERFCDGVLVGDLDELDLTLSLEGRRYDVVIAGDVLEHLKDPARTLRQVRELLDDDGYIAVSVPNMSHGSVRLALLHGDLPPSETGLLDRTHVQFLTRERLADLLAEGGFEAARIDGTRLPVRDSEVPFPDDELTASVLETIERQPDATIYQFVAVAFPRTDQGLQGLSRVVRELDHDLTHSREHASQWEARGLAAETTLAELRAHLAAERQTQEEAAVAKLIPLRLELLAARDQVAHREHELELAAHRYNDKTAILRESEAERAQLRTELTQVQQELAAMRAQRAYVIYARARALLGRARRLMSSARG